MYHYYVIVTSIGSLRIASRDITMDHINGHVTIDHQHTNSIINKYKL